MITIFQHTTTGIYAALKASPICLAGTSLMWCVEIWYHVTSINTSEKPSVYLTQYLETVKLYKELVDLSTHAHIVACSRIIVNYYLLCSVGWCFINTSRDLNPGFPPNAAGVFPTRPLGLSKD
jgi:hypothetical protein